jgi:predicted GH43/DUF377 family glycosyl hydrolase
VIHTDAGYFMYYTAAATQFGDTTIAVATSSDGTTWEKRAEPVIVADREWEHDSVDRPRAVVVGDRIAMVYAGGILTDRGLAWSDDGITWRKDGDAPVITDDAFPVSGRAWDAALIQRDGMLVYYLEIGVAVRESGTQVFRATASLEGQI